MFVFFAFIQEDGKTACEEAQLSDMADLHP